MCFLDQPNNSTQKNQTQGGLEEGRTQLNQEMAQLNTTKLPLTLTKGRQMFLNNGELEERETQLNPEQDSTEPKRPQKLQKAGNDLE